MKTQLLAVLLISIICAKPAHSQCVDYQLATRKLKSKYSESLVFRGWSIAQQGQPAREIVEIWAGLRSWTVLRRQIMQAGSRYIECVSMTSQGGVWDGQARPGFGLPGPF